MLSRFSAARSAIRDINCAFRAGIGAPPCVTRHRCARHAPLRPRRTPAAASKRPQVLAQGHVDGRSGQCM